jgi:hypothetical protein
MRRSLGGFAVFDLILLFVAATPLIAFVWLVAKGQYAEAAFPLTFGLMFYGVPIGEMIVRFFSKSRRMAIAIYAAWIVGLIVVGIVYFGWTQGLPFGDWTQPKPIQKSYQSSKT